MTEHKIIDPPRSICIAFTTSVLALGAVMLYSLGAEKPKTVPRDILTSEQVERAKIYRMKDRAFDIADQNDDGVLDGDEIKRYRGFVDNYTVGGSR